MIQFPTPTIITIAPNQVRLDLEVSVTPLNQFFHVYLERLKHDTLVLQGVGNGNNTGSPTVTILGIDVSDGDRLFVTTDVTSLSASAINVVVNHAFTPAASISATAGSTSLPFPAVPPAQVNPGKSERFYAQFNIKA